MYEKDGEKYFIVDGHMHWWNAAPENWRHKEYGEGWIRCFYGYHSALSPEEYVWSFEKYCAYSEEDLMKDLFEDPQLASRSVWQQLEHRSIGPQRYRMVSYQLSKTPGGVSRPSPCLGQDNELVFRQWLGLGAEEYDKLAARGAFA